MTTARLFAGVFLDGSPQDGDPLVDHRLLLLKGTVQVEWLDQDTGALNDSSWISPAQCNRTPPEWLNNERNRGERDLLDRIQRNRQGSFLSGKDETTDLLSATAMCVISSRSRLRLPPRSPHLR